MPVFRHTAALVLLLVSLKAYSQPPEAPSFDCSNATSFSEKTICADRELSRLDREMASIYRKARDSAADLKKFQNESAEEWRLREQCRDDACVRQWYDKRKLQLTAAIVGTAPVENREVVSIPPSQAHRPVVTSQGIFLQDLVAATLPDGSDTSSALDWSALASITGLKWNTANPTATVEGFVMDAVGNLGSEPIDISFFGARSMVFGFQLSITTPGASPSFQDLLSSQLPGAKFSKLRGSCPNETSLNNSEVFTANIPGKKPMFIKATAEVGPRGGNEVSLRFAVLMQDDFRCSTAPQQTNIAVNSSFAQQTSEGRPPLSGASPSIVSRLTWTLIGLAALLLPLLFLLASRGAHGEMSARFFFDTFNRTGRVDPYGAQLQASLWLIIFFLLAVLSGPWIIWEKVVSPSIQRHDSQVRTVCCIDSTRPAITGDGRLVVDLYRSDSFISQLFSDLLGSKKPHHYGLRIVDTRAGEFINLRAVGAGGDDKTIELITASVTSDPEVVFYSDRIEVVGKGIGVPDVLMHTIPASAIGFRTLAVKGEVVQPRLRAKGSIGAFSSSESEFSQYQGRIEVFDSRTGQNGKVTLPFDTTILKAAGDSELLFMTEREHTGFAQALLYFLTGLNSTTNVAVVNATSGQTILKDSFFAAPPQFVGASADGNIVALIAGKYLKIYTAR